MSMIQSDLLLGQEGGAGYAIERSLRFNSSDSAYLSRTPASEGNRKTWTWAAWVKRTSLGTLTPLFSGDNALGGGDALSFSSSDELRISWNGAINGDAITLAKFRDPSAWYHIVLSVDLNQGTEANRVKIYVNNTQQELTAGPFGGTYGTYPATTYNTEINTATSQWIGRGGNTYGSFYLAECYFIDGQALDPTSFTETDATTGQLIPKAYSGTFGTNGFHLPFSDNSTAAALGTDTSGNGNTWTVNNISVAAGSGNDSLVDTPTSYGTDTGAGGEVRGNYCTLNPLDNTGKTLSNGNLEMVGAGNTFHGIRSTIGLTTGKWYFECTVAAEGGETRTGPGIYRSSDVLAGDFGNGTVVVYDYLGILYVRDESGAGSTWYSTSGSVSAGDVFGFAFDLDAQKVWVHQNGTWLNSGNPGAGTGAVVTSLPAGTYFPGGWAYNASDNLVFNFGQRAFAYNSNRSGFEAICDTSLPSPVVAQPSTVMDILLWTGDGTSPRSFSGLSFSPDLVWIKQRSSTADHALINAVRGPAGNSLSSNLTSAESDAGLTVDSFDSNGFTLSTGSFNFSYANTNAATYAGWCWDAGSSTVTNTDGSITSTVRANASAGFSIVTYTGTGVAGTIGHGLNVSPEFIIVKDRGSSADWHIWHSRLNNGVNAGQYVLIFTTASTFGPNSVWWNDTTPSSTVFSVGGGSGTSGSGSNYVAYCFAPVTGLSSFGVYQGNGSTDGPFVFTGMRPRWVLFKASSTTGDWRLMDTSRDLYNPEDSQLYPNNADAEITSALHQVDYLSNGFKVVTGSSAMNASGVTYIYAAFAESPFQYARAR